MIDIGLMYWTLLHSKVLTRGKADRGASVSKEWLHMHVSYTCATDSCNELEYGYDPGYYAARPHLFIHRDGYRMSHTGARSEARDHSVSSTSKRRRCTRHENEMLWHKVERAVQCAEISGFKCSPQSCACFLDMLGLWAWGYDMNVILFEFLDDDTKLSQSCRDWLYVQHWNTVVPDPAMRVTLPALLGTGDNCNEHHLALFLESSLALL